MAKKKQDLTQEELLEQALVSESEWPYKVPENWVWVRLGACLYSGKEKQDNFDDDATAYVGLEHIHSNNGIVSYGSSLELKSLKNVFKEGDILYGKLRPYLNKHDIAPFDGVCSTDILVLRSRKITNNDYINYLIDTERLIEHAVKNSKGINLPRVSENELFEFSTPIPPLAEQQRIVDRIESLFEKLDQSKGLIQEALDSFENRKAAILRKAFSGELTKNWREENGIGMESWREKRLGELLNPMVTRKPNTLDEYFRYIDIDAIDNKIQQVKEPKKLLVSEAPSRASRNVEAGDILFSMVRPYLKNIAYISEDLSDCIASTGFYVCRCKGIIDSKFLYYILCAQETIDYLNSFMKGDNSPSIRKEDFEGLTINLPSSNEQEVIVNSLNELLGIEQNAKDLCNIIDNIDLMKKAILARAFRGELGTNDPEEESAMELLKSVLGENAGESK